jgi:AcrR family transcriptional regulator
MKWEATRRYRQTARAVSAGRTRHAVMQAAVELWREHLDLDQVTLAQVAERAGVSRQTVLRKFGSKDGLIEACIEEGASGIVEMRDQAPTGDIPEALDILLAHYEKDGPPALSGLALEHRSEAAARIAAHGRATHRAWCARVFEPFLPAPDDPDRAARLDAFVAATDLYVWKLLRQDLGRSATETREAMQTLVEALASSSPTRKAR